MSVGALAESDSGLANRMPGVHAPHAGLHGGGGRAVSGSLGQPLAEVANLCPVAAQAADYWRRIHPAPGVLPGRQHLDPLDIPALLPQVWMIDVERTPDAAAPRFRCRLYGTGLVRAFGHDLTGRDLGDPELGFAGSAAEVDFRRVADEGLGLWWRGPVAMAHNRHVSGVEVVMLPLAADGRTVDLIFCVAEVVRRV